MSTMQSSTVSSTLLSTMNGTRNTAASEAAAAQNRFMTLLVTQMKNQDPLNPLDNAQVTSQLAQLSTVTGINKLNTTLESMMSQSQASQSLQASSMIGHTVLVAGNKVELYAGKGVFAVDLPSTADSVKVTIRDSTGAAVRTLSLGQQATGVLQLPWNGTTDSGSAAADGGYTFEVKAMLAGKAVDATALSYGAVSSVSTNSSSGVQLNLGNMGAVSLSDIKQIY
jgi:flagellar basal-body rod modification protein FlgD